MLLNVTGQTNVHNVGAACHWNLSERQWRLTRACQSGGESVETVATLRPTMTWISCICTEDQLHASAPTANSNKVELTNNCPVQLTSIEAFQEPKFSKIYRTLVLETPQQTAAPINK